MRQISLILVVLTLSLGAGAVGAKVVNVTNPMTSDLDGGGHDISNVLDLLTTNGVTSGAFYVGSDFSSFAIKAGFVDPSQGFGVGARPGSLYLSNPDGFAGGADSYGTRGALYVKTGPNATDWTCIAGCSS